MAHATHVSTGSSASLYKLTSLRLAHNAKVSAQRARSQRMDREEDQTFSYPGSYPVRTTTDLRAPPQTILLTQDSSGQPKGTIAVHPTESSHVQDSIFAEWSTNRDEYIDFIDRIEQEQEDIRDAREDLLGSRFRLQYQRRELLKTRVNTAAHVGATFDRIREHLLTNNVPLPYDIEVALSSTEQLRNDLGDREVEYDEAERVYNQEEWEYTQKESRFIHDMCGATPIPKAVNKIAPPLEYTDGATQFSLGRQDIENMVAEAEGDVPCQLVDIEGTLEGDSELSEARSTVMGDILKPYGRSDDQHSSSTHDLTADTSKSLLFTELELAATRQKWAGTRRSIDEWLLHALELSRFEKLRFQTCLSEHTKMEEWWSLVDQNWYPDSPSGSRHHTDTSLSEETLSDALSSNALHHLFGVSDIQESAAQGFSELPLLGHDRVLDDFDEVNFPTDIEPLDLVDWPVSPVKSRSRNSRRRYGIARHTSISRIGSYPDFSTCSTIEEESPATMSVSNDSEQRGKDSTSFTDASLEHHSSLQTSSALPEGSFEEGFTSSMCLTVETKDEAAMQFVRTSLKADNESHNKASNSGSQSANVHSSGHVRNTSMTSRDDDDGKKSTSAARPSPPSKDLRAFRTEHYIVVPNREPWHLPLLKLMASAANPLESNPTSRSRHKLEALPFVETFDSPLRLPGPSEYF